MRRHLPARGAGRPAGSSRQHHRRGRDSAHRRPGRLRQVRRRGRAGDTRGCGPNRHGHHWRPRACSGSASSALSVVVALDVVVAWALCRVFGPVSTGISLLAAWFRLVYAGVLLVAVSHLVGVLRLLGDDQLSRRVQRRPAAGPGTLRQSIASATSSVPVFSCSACTCSSSATWPIDPATFRGFWLSCWPWPASATWSTASRRSSPGVLDRRLLVHLHRRVPAGAVAGGPRSPHHPGRTRAPRRPDCGCTMTAHTDRVTTGRSDEPPHRRRRPPQQSRPQWSRPQ